MLFYLTPTLPRKIVVVMPAYNAARTLKITYDDLPRGDIGEVILVDDASRDETVRVAKELGLTVYVHSRNYGYGGNQKTCYTEALKSGATIVVMVHPDYQYDPRLVPEMIGPIERDEADVVFGSRMMGVSAYKQGMPWWKYLANRFLTGAENRTFGLHLSEFHTGYRAYRREVLESVNFRANSDNFIFDQEIVAQIDEGGWRIAEIPVPVRYFPEASSASFTASTRYGFSILWLLARYRLHKAGLRSQQFVSFRQRYRRVS
jgi:glycosyltransferase involved in cell wall biosynthesis